MPRDQLDEVLNIQDSRMQREVMEGPGFISYQLRTYFRDLCRVVGKDSARQEMAEIINDEFERKAS